VRVEELEDAAAALSAHCGVHNRMPVKGRRKDRWVSSDVILSPLSCFFSFQFSYFQIRGDHHIVWYGMAGMLVE
jgi:hypothetical protein